MLAMGLVSTRRNVALCLFLMCCSAVLALSSTTESIASTISQTPCLSLFNGSFSGPTCTIDSIFSSFTPTATATTSDPSIHSDTTFTSVSSAVSVSASFPTESTSSSFGASFTPSASRIGPGGISVQPSPDPAATHPFSPFPSPTQKSVNGLYPATDPLSPPAVSSNPQVIPNFNPAWTAAWEKARALIANFSVEQKANITTGITTGARCVGNTAPVPYDDSGPFHGLCLEDSPLGVRLTDFATVFPAGINVASTWQRSLMRARGVALGQEFKGKGVNVALGPMMNLMRVAQAGRSWEGFGADPFLSGESAFETILGMQAAGVQATAKHYINNEQEHSRTTESSNVADRTEHELYAHPFLRSVMAGVSAVMCSYNQINETYACENDRTLNQILKGEFGFRGYVMSDWGATHSTLGAVYGLDLEMPGGDNLLGANLVKYVNNGSIAESRLDDMVTRVVAGWYYLHQDEASYPAVNFNANDPLDPTTNERVDVQDDHAIVVRKIGAASTILLKNTNGTLPLVKPRSIALIGSDAGPAAGGPNEFSDRGGDAGILAVGWGSGTANFTYLVSPLEAIQLRAREDRTTVNWCLEDFNTLFASSIALQAEVSIVFINADSGEGYISVDGNQGDRNNLTAWHGGDALVTAVASTNPNTIVVVHSVGPLILEPWIENENITAVLWAGLGGTETGNALVDVLYGNVNPSGRLPYTISKNASDYGIELLINNNDNSILQIPYTEGLLVDYRHFDANNIEPRFEFGFGLSYTTFAYSNLHVSEIASSFEEQAQRWKKGLPSPMGEGSSTALWLHEPAYEIFFDIENTGTVAGTEIPQLYVNHPSSAGEPPSILKGFSDVELAAGKKGVVNITLSRYDLSVWDVISQSWRRPEGSIKVTVGASSRAGRLSGKIP